MADTFADLDIFDIFRQADTFADLDIFYVFRQH